VPHGNSFTLLSCCLSLSSLIQLSIILSYHRFPRIPSPLNSGCWDSHSFRKKFLANYFLGLWSGYMTSLFSFLPFAKKETSSQRSIFKVMRKCRTPNQSISTAELVDLDIGQGVDIGKTPEVSKETNCSKLGWDVEMD
jgi:hypothetical protein